MKLLDIGLILSVIIGSCVDDVTSQTLHTNCACYGNDATVDSIQADCSAVSGVIAIKSLYRGTKLSSTGCPQTATDADRDVANCCTYNSGTDCQVIADSIDAGFSSCSGQTTCSQQVTWTNTPTSCTDTAAYHSFTNFMCIEYYCAPTSDVAGICGTSGTDFSGSVLYLWNDQYPSAINQISCCTCSVQTSASSATITLKTVDFQLYDASSTCQQTIEVNNGGTWTEYTCTSNSRMIQELLTSTGNSLSMTLNSDVSGNGYFWLSVEASQGTLTMTCNSVTVCPDQTTASTSTTATTTASSSDSGNSGSNSSSSTTYLFGLSFAMFMLFTCLLGAFLLAMFLVLACVCYRYGKTRADYDLDKQTKNEGDKKDDHTSDTIKKTKRSTRTSIGPATNLQPQVAPVSYTSPPPSYRSGISPSQGNPLAQSSRGGMFTYRPYDPTLYVWYKHRNSLPQVD